MNRVLLTGRLTRDPEMRALASGKHVTTMSVATNEYIGNGREKAEYHAVITWDRLADICAQYLFTRPVMITAEVTYRETCGRVHQEVLNADRRQRLIRDAGEGRPRAC